MSVPALDLLALLRLPGVGPRGAVRIALDSFEEVQRSAEWPAVRAEAEEVADDCATLGIGIVGWFDNGFPPRLRTIPEPPAVLFFRGNLVIANFEPAAAVVGTRRPTPSGVRAAREVTESLAKAGWSIVSGLALGVDTVAHRTALASGAPTIAILGNGLADVYPSTNKELADEIVKAGGALLAEVPPRQRVDARALVRRDRLQSGLSSITIVCQGGVNSGAMHTARYAHQQRRPLFVPSFAMFEPEDDEDRGTHALATARARDLPGILPAWKRVPQRQLQPEPVARVLDPGTLPTRSTPHPPGPERLF